MNRIAVEQVKRLRQIGFHLHFARTDGLAGGPSESGEEVSGGVAICDLDGPRPEWQSLKLIWGFGYLRQSVEQYFCSQPSDQRVGKVGEILFICLVLFSSIFAVK